MKMRTKYLVITGLILGTAITGSAAAAPGTLSNSPLFLAAKVEPNVFWTMDDSGSMEWEMSVEGGSSGLPNFNGYYSYYVLPSPNNYLSFNKYYPTDYPYTVESNSRVSGAWRAKNHNYNKLYYNPAKTYTPWAGVNASGTPLFTNSTPAAAPADPARSASGTFNLTSNFSFWNYDAYGWYSETVFPAQYYEWTDTDNDGNVDAGDSHSQILIQSSQAPFVHTVSERTDCANPNSCTYAEEIQNFANWYTYYRKRSYVAKAVMGALIAGNAGSRMGIQLFTGGRIANATSMSNSTNRLSLLNTLYGTCIACRSTASSYGTPARIALKNVGDYFAGVYSPILGSGSGGECQQNFNILLTDGYWNGSSPNVGNRDGGSYNDTDFDGGIYADSYSNTLADVAMKYYETDLKSTIPDYVPTISGVDEASHQHLVTYTVAFGVTGTLDPQTQHPSDAGFSWPDPFNGDAEKIDDMWHAAFNSRGQFLSAQNPEELAQSLTDALSNIEDRTGSAAAVAFNTSTLNADSSVFLVLFNSNRWSGMIYRYDLDPNTGAVSTTADWEASQNLDNRNLNSSPRTIITHNGSDGIPFTWNNLTANQKTDLKTNPSGGTDSDTIGQARLEYLRGDRSNEGTGYQFRTRSSRLGDIVHSNPVYSGSPQMSWPDDSPFPTGSSKYSAWVSSSVKDRVPVLYVGANDGMLHAFRASDGHEMFAYIPSNLFSSSTSNGLHYLTNPNYLHRYYVDASPKISDAYIKVTTGGSAAWRTILVGSQRAGGKGIFALDISNPANFDETNAADMALWEFTESDLGHTYGEPTIAMLNNNKWAVILGNGYNDSGAGQAKLFIIYIEEGIDGTWTGGEYLKISTGSGSTSNRNGLSTPAVIDLDGNGTADRVYAGDLFGDMWAFDLSDASDTNWDVAYKQGSTPKPLFSGGSTKPITHEPIISVHPTEETSNNNSPNLMVYFGTGQYLVDADKSSTGQQTQYGVWDEGEDSLTYSDLVAQTVTLSQDGLSRTLSDNSVAYDGTGSNKKYGWYINLPSSGERSVVRPALRGDILYFNTMIPSSNPCDYGGSGWLMGANAENGGLPDDGKKVFNNGSTTVISGVKYEHGIPAQSAFLGNYQYTPGTNTFDGTNIQVAPVPELGGGETGKLSWKEMLID